MSSSKVALPIMPVDLSHLPFDSTNKADYQLKEARIRGTEVYLTSALFAEMEETWGGSFVAVKTITDIPNQRVYVFPAGKETDIVPVRKTDTLSAATFSFFIPMQKLNLKLRKDRQIVVVPTAVPVKERSVAYCFALAGVRATKRPRVPEVDGGTPAQPKSTDAANPAAIPGDALTATDVTKPAPEAKKAEGSPKSPKGAPAAASTQSTTRV